VREGPFLQLRILFFFLPILGSHFLLCFFFEFAGGVTVHVVIFFFSFRTLFFLCFVHTDLCFKLVCRTLFI
jgi:hypothetical protein